MSQDERKKVHADVTLTVRVAVDVNWGMDWRIGDLHKAAIEAAKNYLYRRTEADPRLTIVSEPTVSLSTVVVKS